MNYDLYQQQIMEHIPVISLFEIYHIRGPPTLKNKAFVGLGSRDNVQTEMPIFKYANCQGFKYKELVRPAGLSIWFVQLVHQAGPSGWSVYKVKVLIFVHGKGNSREKLVTRDQISNTGN